MIQASEGENTEIKNSKASKLGKERRGERNQKHPSYAGGPRDRKAFQNDPS